MATASTCAGIAARSETAHVAWGAIVFADKIWQAPLLPVALAFTAGVVIDRYASVPLPFSLLICGAALAATWPATRGTKRAGLALVYLLLAVAAFGAGYHHWRRDVYLPDDIGRHAQADPRPIRVRGLLVEEPAVVQQVHKSALRVGEREDQTVAVLEARQLRMEDEWQAVSGRARLVAFGYPLKFPNREETGLASFHAGDEVEVVGRLVGPHGPSNPGEADEAAWLRDRGIRAVVLVRKSPDAVRRTYEGWNLSFRGWLGVVRAWGQQVLANNLPPDRARLAMALLLGEDTALSAVEWGKYKRTGVIHVLAISGLHLIILGGFLSWVLHFASMRLRWRTTLVAVFLVCYALLAGGRAPAIRAAVMVCACCGAVLLSRPVLSANTFALCWLVVAALNPMDLFTPGCLLSFLAVAVLCWGTRRWFEWEGDPLLQLGRPSWEVQIRKVARKVAVAYLITFVIWLISAPLVAYHYHVVALPALLIGPLAVVLGSLALEAGFLLLVSAAVFPPLVPVFARVTNWLLAGCESLVDWSDWPSRDSFYVGNVSEWWLWVFYPGLLAVLLVQPLYRRRFWALAAAGGWLCVGLAASWAWPAPRDPAGTLRCTFLAVGHGGCTVLEMPDGRTFLYDAGAITGPGVTQRQIAPFLWHRGIRRIDEVLLSHADLDHFNGLSELIERFSVGQVTCTPTFADKSNRPVLFTLAALERQGIPRRVVSAGDRLSVGEVEMDVLHPPPVGPEGNENTRSMVLLVRHAEHSILLTGDLEGLGLQRVLSFPAPKVDVLMAPHHGSRAANTPDLAAWAAPRLVISCQGPPRWPSRAPDPYTARGVKLLGTWPHGAVTIRSERQRLAVETFQSREQFDLSGEKPP